MSETRNNTKKWYVISTFTNRERAVADALEKRKIAFDLQNNIFRIVVAEKEEPVLDKEGRPTGKTKKVNFYPGYVFVEMIMSDDAWFVVRNTPDASGFVGSSGKGTKPFPVSNEEIEPILKRLKIAETIQADYKVGDHVRIISSTFEGTEGYIDSINQETGEAVVNILMFGKPQPISVDFSEIELIKE